MHTRHGVGSWTGQSEGAYPKKDEQRQERPGANDCHKAFLWEKARHRGLTRGGTTKPLVWLGLLVQSIGQGTDRVDTEI